MSARNSNSHPNDSELTESNSSIVTDSQTLPSSEYSSDSAEPAKAPLQTTESILADEDASIDAAKPADDDAPGLEIPTIDVPSLKTDSDPTAASDDSEQSSSHDYKPTDSDGPLEDDIANSDSLAAEVSRLLQEHELLEDLPLIPMRGMVVFPNVILSLTVQRPASLAALDHCLKNNRHVVMMTQKNEQVEDITRRDLYSTGTLCTVVQMLRLPDQSAKIVVQGISRVRIAKTLQSTPFFRIKAKLVNELRPNKEETDSATHVVLNQFRHLANLSHGMPPEMILAVLNIQDSGHLADVVSFHLDLTLPERQHLLETRDVAERLRKLSVHLSREIEILKIENKIQTRAEREMAKGNKDYFLRQQLKAIQEELGDDDDDKEEVAQLESDIKAANMPEPIAKHAFKELRKMERTHPSSPDRAVIRTYLDWMLQVPWSKRTEDRLDIRQAESILNEDHYGLKDVKERILEFLSVRQLKQSHRGPILCFVGPPGVGKTSLGRSIARTLGRKFNRTSLGGVHDEAEIRGHRRTYVGALPGRIIQSLCTAESINPVIMLDEIDKIGKDFRGDPSAALLEALDPEQNYEFKDHYLSVPVDLSSTMFIMTANVMDTIPSALRDRMETIRIPGYTVEEKIKIATGFLIPRQLDQHGLQKTQLSLTEEAVYRIIREYTREAGVRGLERQIARLCRKRARQIVEAKRSRKKWAVLTANDIPTLLGIPKYSNEKLSDKPSIPGCANGLSWTQVGGEMLTIETSIIPGRGKVTLTGSLGQVMKESARAAITWVRGYLNKTNTDFDYYRNDIHIHVPEGAIPKDGPSAGVTMMCSFLSAVTQQPVRPDLAMTGEITLTGKVMPVGGIKEKVLAAFNADILTIILPKENEKNLEEIPEEIRSKMTFHMAEYADDVIRVAFDSPHEKVTP